MRLLDLCAFLAPTPSGGLPTPVVGLTVCVPLLPMRFEPLAALSPARRVFSPSYSGFIPSALSCDAF